MGRKANDGRGRLGGRTVGTKNKPKPEPVVPMGEWVENLINKHRGAIEHALLVPTGEQGTPLLAALLVVSALNRATTALRVATHLLPADTDTEV